VRVIAALAVTCAAALAQAPVLAWSGGSGAPVPAGFKANSVTWLSAQRGWVLGAAPCGRHTCADVIGTTNAATTWRLVGTVPAPIAMLGGAQPGVAEIRFATATVGWAFGPQLWRTSSGGRSWARVRIPGGGQQVLALAASPTYTYAVVSACALGTGICPRPLGFWRTPTAAGGGWARIPVTLPPNGGADVAVSGTTVYVVDEQLQFGGADRFYASTGGRRFAARPVPCSHAKNLALIQAVPMSARRVALLCVGNPGYPGPADATKSVYTSADTGTTDRYAGTTGPLGIAAQLAASPSGNLAVAAVSAGSFLYINDTHKQAWTMVKGLNPAPWNDLSYVTDSQAWVIYGPASAGGPGQLWGTRDAGKHWTIAKL
jgi:hypothetical protein